MLQNRVDPSGHLITTKARGAWMGNRGILHDERQQVLRPFKLKAWITCLLAFKGRQREVMAPRHYTELFFLDEATAFSAGHRPCFECRRQDYQRFKTAWLAGNPAYGFHEKTSIRAIDDILHRERVGSQGEKVTFEASPASLPDGTFVLWNGHPHLLANGQLFAWDAAGYKAGVPVPDVATLPVLTPRSVVNVFKAGYIPQMSITLP